VDAPVSSTVTGTVASAASPLPQRPRLGIPTKFLYGMGAMSGSVKARLLGWLLVFYTQVIGGVDGGLSPAWFSVAASISILVDAFWDPIVGQLSDGTRTPLGRRHPFIYGAVLPSAAFFVMLFVPPATVTGTGLFVYLLIALLGMRFFDSLVDIPSAALMPELTPNYDERTTVQSYRYLFSTVIGGALGTILAYRVFLHGTKAQPQGQLLLAGYAPFAVTSAIIGVVVVLVAALATQRFVPHMHRPPSKRPSLGAIIRVIGPALGNRNFLAIAVSSLIFGIAVGMSAGLGGVFYTYIFQLTSVDLLKLGLWVIPAGLFGVVLAPQLSRRMDKRNACLATFFTAIASTTVPLGAWLLGLMPPHAPWVLPVIIIDSMATSALATTGFIIVSSMTADVVDQNQLHTGARSEGLLFSAESLVRKVTTSFAALIPGLLLAMVHFHRHEVPGKVPVEKLQVLAIIYLVVYTSLTLCSTGALFFYRIDRGQHEDNIERLADAAALAEAAQEELEMVDGPIAPRPI